MAHMSSTQSRRTAQSARDGRLQVGDGVVAIGTGSDGPLEDIRHMTPAEASKRLQGEPGTLIRFQFTRPGSTELLTATIQRDTSQTWLRAVIRAAESDAWRLARLDARCIDDFQQRRAAMENWLALPTRALSRRVPCRIWPGNCMQRVSTTWPSTC